MDKNEFFLKLVEYISMALTTTSFLCSVAADVFACMILLGMFKGEWSFLHLLAMLLIAGAFASVSGVCLAIYDSVAPPEEVEE